MLDIAYQAVKRARLFQISQLIGLPPSRRATSGARVVSPAPQPVPSGRTMEGRAEQVPPIPRRSPRGHGGCCRTLLVIVACYLTGCRAVGTLAPDASIIAATPVSAPASTETPGTSLAMGDPPGPVLTISPLTDGQFLAGVGPIGDAETNYEWRLYLGRDDDWRRLSWPTEAIPRSLHFLSNQNLLFAVPFSNALFGRGQAWGLMRSLDGGRSWQQALNGLGDPYVMDLTVAPTCRTDADCTIFVVTWYSGVYRSTDAGETWELMPLSEEVEPSGGANPYDLAVAISPNWSESDGEGLVIASVSHGLHRRDTQAETWQTIPLTVTAAADDFDPAEARLTAGEVAFSPDFADDGTVYLLSGYAGLFRSADRGETWRRTSRRLPLPAPFVTDFRLVVASADEAYLLLDSGEIDQTFGRPSRVLYRTSDGGRSWETLNDPPTLGWVSAFALARDREGQVVLHLGGSRGGVSSHLADALLWDSLRPRIE